MINRQTGYLPSNSMKELILDNEMLLPAISRFNIAFGFGDNPIGNVCRDNNVDTSTFLAVANLLSGYSCDPSQISLPSLMGYLKKAHSSFLDIQLPKIRRNLLEAINYADSGEVVLLLMRFFDEYILEVRRHMEHENDVVFSYVEQLLSGEPAGCFNIDSYSTGHDDTAAKLKDLKDIFIYHYKQRENPYLNSVLLDIIICERDMMSHFEVENRLFIPSVRSLESSRKKAGESASQRCSDRKDAEENALATLSEREKEIIRGVARGKVNKEIADELCISVHTVATHRRNISAKLDIHSSSGLTIFAIINHLVDINSVTPA